MFGDTVGVSVELVDSCPVDEEGDGPESVKGADIGIVGLDVPLEELPGGVGVVGIVLELDGGSVLED